MQRIPEGSAEDGKHAEVQHGLGRAVWHEMVPRNPKSRLPKEAMDMKHHPAKSLKCAVCQAELGSVCYISCAVCKDLQLCIGCYSSASRLKRPVRDCHSGHKSSHPYKVCQKYNFPIFRPDWTASDELMLINGLIFYGVGNWSGISSQVQHATRSSMTAYARGSMPCAASCTLCLWLTHLLLLDSFCHGLRFCLL
jgi:hypothetical protein